MMYLIIAIAAYVVVLFLTLRDIRIYKRTRYQSYRKGAMKGIAAMFATLFGVVLTLVNPSIGLLLVLLGLFINRKGVREKVFQNAGTLDRFLGKTDINNQ